MHLSTFLQKAQFLNNSYLKGINYTLLVDSIVYSFFFTYTVAEETKSWPGMNRGSLSLRNCRSVLKLLLWYGFCFFNYAL